MLNEEVNRKPMKKLAFKYKQAWCLAARPPISQYLQLYERWVACFAFLEHVIRLQNLAEGHILEQTPHC